MRFMSPAASMSAEARIMWRAGGSWMPDLEAIGDAATGAVLAGAVEPRTGSGDDGHTHENELPELRRAI